jgi:trehalose/maltose transport system permease protein
MSSPSIEARPQPYQALANRKLIKKIAGKTAFYLLIVIILFYIIFPFYWAIVSSLKPMTELYSTPLTYWPVHLTFENYGKVLGDNLFLHALLNSTIVSFSVTLISVVLGSLAAYALGRFRFRGRSFILYLILSMTLFPTIAVLGGLFQIVSSLHTILYDQLTALILTYLIFTMPFTVWVLRSFFQSIPVEIEEAAYVDGATPWQIYYRVMIPLALPGLATTGLLAFIQAWNELLFALSFIITPERQTVALAITNFQPQGGQGFAIDWGQVMAATVIVTLPLVALALIFQRLILSGLTAGGVKG